MVKTLISGLLGGLKMEGSIAYVAAALSAHTPRAQLSVCESVHVNVQKVEYE